MNTKPLSKATRFEVFKRDKFTCQYCGAKAPDVMLECDHIHPRAQDGGNDVINLLTACHACNNGKRDKTLSDDSVVAKQHAQLAQLQDRREQLEMMMEWQRGLVDLTGETVKAIGDLFIELVPGWRLSDEGLNDVRANLSRYPVEEIITMLREAVAKHARYADGKVTEEASNYVTSGFLNELKYRHKWQKDPVGSELAYIAGIVRRRSFKWTNWHAGQCRARLREAYDEGVPLPELKTIAVECTSWGDWTSYMDNYLGGFREAVAKAEGVQS